MQRNESLRYVVAYFVNLSADADDVKNHPFSRFLKSHSLPKLGSFKAV
jgi:hypothetical protein